MFLTVDTHHDVSVRATHRRAEQAIRCDGCYLLRTGTVFLSRARQSRESNVAAMIQRFLYGVTFAALASCVRADDRAAQFFGLFDMARTFLAAREAGAAPAPAPMPARSITFGDGDFSKFIDAARLLAIGKSDVLTMAHVDSVLRDVESKPSFEDLSLSLRGLNGTDALRAFELFFNDTNTDDAIRRRAFARVFNGVINATASAVLGFVQEGDDTALPLAMAGAVDDASMFANLIFTASNDVQRRLAALALYDRVAGTIAQSREILRDAMRDGADAATANALIAAVLGESAEHQMFDANITRWRIESTTTRDPGGRALEHVSAVIEDEGKVNDDIDDALLTSVVLPVVGAVVGFATILFATVAIGVHVRRRRRQRLYNPRDAENVATGAIRIDISEQVLARSDDKASRMV